MNNSLVTHAVGDGTVEFLVPTFKQMVGENTTAEVRFTGDRSRALEEVTVAFETHYRTDDGFETVTIDRTTLATDLFIESGLAGTRRVPLSIPYDVPNTHGSCDVLAHLELESERVGEEYLSVEPTEQFQAALQGLVDLGFVLRRAECRVDDRPGGQPFVQQFDFEPRDGPLEGDLDVLELFVEDAPGETTLHAAVDRDGDLNPVPETEEATEVVQSIEHRYVRDQMESFVRRNVRN